MQPPGPNASAATVAAAIATDEAVKFAVPELLRQLFSTRLAANRSNLRLGARFSRPLPVALLLVTLLPRAVTLKMAMPARPLS